MKWAVCILLLVHTSDAWARVGGGHHFSTGGGGGGGGGGSGGGGELLEVVFYLLLELCIRYPIIGIPLMVVFIAGVIWWRWRMRGENERVAIRAAQLSGSRSKGRAGTSIIVARDPNFSEPLFLEFAELMYTRVQSLRAGQGLETLWPLCAEEPREELAKGSSGLSDVRDVVIGSSRIVDVRTPTRWSLIQVEFEANLTEVDDAGNEQRLLCNESWVFRRIRTARSPVPQRMRSLGCPGCGSTSDARKNGTCPNCDSPRAAGRRQWEVSRIASAHHSPLPKPTLQMGGGTEPGFSAATRCAHDLDAQRRAFNGRHPDHEWGQFSDQIKTLFVRLQAAWSAGDLAGVRHLESDSLFQNHRFWLERYAKAGLSNRIENVEVHGIDISRIHIDAFYEAVTARIRASGLDWTENASGQIVGGSKTDRRQWSEYWTLLRTVGSPDTWKLDACPSCGAPLDRINMSGVCGYCEAKVTSGTFGWVASRIEQDQSHVA